MVDQDEKWGSTSGLPLADADAEIIGLVFGFNAQVGAGRVCANVTFAVLDEDGEVDGEPVDQSFTVGDGWEIAGKGASITGRKKINNQANWGRFAMSCVEAIGGSDKINELLPNTDYREAAGWVGTRWHLDTIEVDGYNPEKKETKKTSKIIATSFLGVNGEAAAPAKTSSSSASGKSTAGKSASGKKPGLADTDPELFAQLLEQANGFDKHDDFVAAVLDDVEDNAAALTAVMSVKAGSVWAAKG